MSILSPISEFKKQPKKMISILKLVAKNLQTLDDVDKQGNVPIVYATENQLNEIVSFLAENGANVNQISNGESALHIALKQKDFETFKVLVNNGGDVNLRRNQPKSRYKFLRRINLIGYAIFFNCIECVNFLIQKGVDLKADVNLDDNKKQTALEFAGSRSNMTKAKIFTLLMDPNSSIADDPNEEEKEEDADEKEEDNSFAAREKRKKKLEMLKAAEENNLRRVQNFLNEGFSANTRVCCNRETLLYFAALNGNLKMVNLLLKKRALVDKIENKEYVTPLIASVLKKDSREKRKAIGVSLLKKGADYRKTNLQGKNYKELAKDFIKDVDDMVDKYGKSKYKKQRMAKEKSSERKNKINYLSSDSQGKKLLKYICSSSLNKRPIESILKKGQDPNKKVGFKPSGEKYNAITPLHCLVTTKMKDQYLKEKLKLLLNKGANPNVSDYDGVSALNWAIMKKNNRVLEIYTQSGVGFNVKDENGNYPLEMAINFKNKEAATLLLKAGANYDLALGNKMSIQRYALKKGFEKSIFKNPKKWIKEQKSKLENNNVSAVLESGEKSVEEIKKELGIDKKTEEIKKLTCRLVSRDYISLANPLGKLADQRVNFISKKVKQLKPDLNKLNYHSFSVSGGRVTKKYFITPLHCTVIRSVILDKDKSIKRAPRYSSHYTFTEGAYLEVAELLLKNGADPSREDYFGKSSLFYAIENNLGNFINLFSKYMNLNTPNKKGVSPVIFAIKEKKLEALKYLIMAGANINVRDPETGLFSKKYSSKIGFTQGRRILNKGKDKILEEELAIRLKERELNRLKMYVKRYQKDPLALNYIKELKRKNNPQAEKNRNKSKSSSYRSWKNKENLLRNPTKRLEKRKIQFYPSSVKIENLNIATPSGMNETEWGSYITTKVIVDQRSSKYNERTLSVEVSIENDSDFLIEHIVDIEPFNKNPNKSYKCLTGDKIIIPPYSQKKILINKKFDLSNFGGLDRDGRFFVSIQKTDGDCPESIQDRMKNNFSETEKKTNRNLSSSDKRVISQGKKKESSSFTRKKNNVCNNLRSHYRKYSERKRLCRKKLVKIQDKHQDPWDGTGTPFSLKWVSSMAHPEKDTACGLATGPSSDEVCKKREMESEYVANQSGKKVSCEATKIKKFYRPTITTLHFCKSCQRMSSSGRKKMAALEKFQKKTSRVHSKLEGMMSEGRKSKRLSSAYVYTQFKRVYSKSKRIFNLIKDIKAKIERGPKGKLCCENGVKLEDYHEEVKKTHACLRHLYTGLPNDLKRELNDLNQKLNF
ncbi:ankyrin repeat domain-containing protein [Bacteriovoracales bacterium]|nr:ankyrin repeat domain-containing protein [Bacteriovoracales bacterium]